MKKLLTLLTVFILFAGSAKADGCGIYRVEFTIEDTKGRVSKGYARAPICSEDSDSLNSIEYLKRTLTSFETEKDWAEMDTLIYFKDKICYEFVNEWDSSGYRYMSCQLMKKAAIPFKSIKSIKIDSMTYIKYTYSIMNELKWSDTVWMKKKPVKIVEAHSSSWGLFCEFQICVHESSEYVNDIIRQIEANLKEYFAICDEYTENTEINKDDVNAQQHQLSDRLDELLKKLNGRKVVILRQCSC